MQRGTYSYSVYVHRYRQRMNREDTETVRESIADELEKLTGGLIDSAFRVHSQIGPALLETISVKVAFSLVGQAFQPATEKAPKKAGWKACPTFALSSILPMTEGIQYQDNLPWTSSCLGDFVVSFSGFKKRSL